MDKQIISTAYAFLQKNQYNLLGGDNWQFILNSHFTSERI